MKETAAKNSHQGVRS